MAKKQPRHEPEVVEAAKVGRPRALVDDDATLKTLEGLARIQCTTKEAAAVMGVSEVTFFAFLKRYEKAREIWDLNQHHGRASLRRMQFKAAEQGNATMQIWLGKQYLDQKDHRQLEVGQAGAFDQMGKDELIEHIRREAAELGVSYEEITDTRGAGKARPLN